jgi:citrate/tricarballylate utilization protein
MSSIGGFPLELLEEGKRVFQICNACRYCEGFCAVFPALERRLELSPGDVNYLANLCHDCGECYYSCPYAPPHEFDVNVPRVLAEVRRESYRRFAWPGFLSRWLGRTGPALTLAILGLPMVFLIGALLFTDPAVFFSAHSVAEGSFYAIVPHTVMVSSFGLVGVCVLLALAVGFAAFWRDVGEGRGTLFSLPALSRAAWDALRLRYLNGGGEGCAYPEEIPSQARRRFHHLTFYGFALCFAATTVAAFYHNVLGWEAPYPFWSVPVLLGSVGGVGLLVGPVGLLWLKLDRNPETADQGQTSMDVAFLVLLFLTSLTGMLLLVLRETAAMSITLVVHLGIVMGLFLTLPYGKFVHGFYRFGALVRNAKEQRR